MLEVYKPMYPWSDLKTPAGHVNIGAMRKKILTYSLEMMQYARKWEPQIFKYRNVSIPPGQWSAFSQNWDVLYLEAAGYPIVQLMWEDKLETIGISIGQRIAVSGHDKGVEVEMIQPILSNVGDPNHKLITNFLLYVNDYIEWIRTFTDIEEPTDVVKSIQKIYFQKCEKLLTTAMVTVII